MPIKHMYYGERIPTEWNVQLNHTNAHAHSVLQLDRIRLTLFCLRLSFCVVFLLLRCRLFSLFWVLSVFLILVRPMYTLYALCWRTFDAYFVLLETAERCVCVYICWNGLRVCLCKRHNEQCTTIWTDFKAVFCCFNSILTQFSRQITFFLLH